MRKIFKFLKVTFVTMLVLLFLIIVGATAFFYFFDLNKYKEPISQLVEKQIGRKLVIAGNAKLGISLIPTLELENVSLSNASWSENPNMLNLERLDVQVSILPLLKKQIEIYKVILIKPEIFLEVNADGKANWDFGLDKTAMLGYKKYAQSSVLIVNDAVVEDAPLANNIPIAGFMAKNILIEDGLVKFVNKQNGQDINLKIRELKLSSKSVDDDMKIDFDVVFNNEDIVGKATLGSVKSLLEAYEPYPIILSAKAYGVTANVEGSVIDALGQNLHYIMNLDVSNPRGNFGAPKARFVGVVDGDLKNVKVDIQSLNLEDNIITGNVEANIAGSVPSVDVKLNSDLIDITKILPKESVVFVFPELISSAKASNLVPETVIPYEFMNMANANLSLNVGKLIVNEDVKFDGVKLTAKLKDGVLKVMPLTLKVDEGDININASVNAKTETIEAKIVSNNLLIQKLYRALETKEKNKFSIVAGGNTEINVDIKGSGRTARTLVNNLDGQVIAIVNKSTINAGELKLLSNSFVGEVMDMLKLNKGKDKQIETTLNCAVLRVDLEKGRAIFPDGIAFDTNTFKLSSDGNINLINDKIAFSVKPFSGKVSDINIAQAVSSFLKITGTIESPKVGIDETQAAKAIVGLATNAPIYAASKTVLDASSAPCYAALENTSYSTLFPKPTGAVATGQGAYKDVEKAVKAGLKEVGSNAKAAGQNVKDTAKGAKEDIKKELDAAKDLIKMFGNKKGK